jgi:hypothetical protein
MEARAARREEWAAKRRDEAQRLMDRGAEHRGDTAFWTQPGRVPERDRIHAAHERGYEASQMADRHQTRAAGIRDQLDRTIFTDDADAIERLREKAARLEAERDRKKAINAAMKKGAGWSDRIEPPLTAEERDELASWARVGRMGFGDLTNISAEIRRCRQRIAEIEAMDASRTT